MCYRRIPTEVLLYWLRLLRAGEDRRLHSIVKDLRAELEARGV